MSGSLTPTPISDVSEETRAETTPEMRFPLRWRTFGGAVGLGLVLAIACVVLGFLVLRLLAAAEGAGLLPTHLLETALRTIGIRWAVFTLSAFSILFYAGFFLGVWIVVRRIADVGWASLGWRVAPLRAYLLVPLIYIATLICSAIALGIEAAVFFHGRVSQINNPKNNPQQAALGVAPHASVAEFLLLIFAIAIVTPIVEELVFRGMLFQLLRRRLPLWGAVILSALVFAMLHFIPVLLPTLFIFGVVLALVFHYTRSLHCSILLHALINAVAVVAIITRP